MLSRLLSSSGGALATIRSVNDTRPPRVLLGNLEPILLVGLRRVLAEDGVDVVGEERSATGIVIEARRLQPDVVLLDLDSLAGKDLGQQIQDVAPEAKVVLWARDETVMEVLDPSSSDVRLVAITAPGELRSELTRTRHRHREEDD
jgi:DNA-binding response OmpR family regulator